MTILGTLQHSGKLDLQTAVTPRPSGLPRRRARSKLCAGASVSLPLAAVVKRHQIFRNQDFACFYDQIHTEIFEVWKSGVSEKSRFRTVWCGLKRG